MTAWALTPFGPANWPVGAMPGFQPAMVPSSVANMNTAEAAVVTPLLFGPAILNAPSARSVLNTVPVGVPLAARLAGVGMFTTSGLIETDVLPAPGTR